MDAVVQGLQQQLQQQAAVQQQQVTLQAEMVTRIQALDVQSTASTARAEVAEQERRDVLRLAAAAQDSNRGGDSLVDGRGVGQPFKFNGKPDQDFSEWSLKLLVYLKAKFGVEVERMMKWAAKQKKVIAMTADTERQVSWSAEFGVDADEIDRVEGVVKTLQGLYTYLISFTTGESNKVVRNVGSDEGLETFGERV
jgi:hypothetical protein